MRLAAALTDDAILYALAASVAFLAFVVLLDPKGLREPIILSLAVLDAGLIMLYVPSVLHRFFGLNVTSIWFAYYYLGTVLLVGTAVLWRTAIMIRAQLRGTKEGP